MNTGKILIGLALLLITVSLVIHPAAARTTDIVPMVGQRNDAFGTALTPPAAFLANVLHSCQTSAGQDQSPVMADCDIPCAADLTVPPRTCTNDDHCTHITCSCVPAIRKMA